VRDVVAFVRETLEASTPRPPAQMIDRRRVRAARAMEDAPTRKDLGLMLKLRNTGRVIGSRPRLALAAGIMLVLASIGTAFGIHAGTARAIAGERTPAGESEPTMSTSPNSSMGVAPAAAGSVQGQR
jgi:hypothetical protein